MRETRGQVTRFTVEQGGTGRIYRQDDICRQGEIYSRRRAGKINMEGGKDQHGGRDQQRVALFPDPTHLLLSPKSLSPKP